MDSVDAVCRVTVVGSARRLDVTLPVGVPVADLVFDLVETMGGRDGELRARGALVRVGGQVLDPERALSEQRVTTGTMLFLRDITQEDPPPAIDDYAAAVAIVVDAQGGRWTAAKPPPALVWGAAASWCAAGLLLLVARDRPTPAAVRRGGSPFAGGSGRALRPRP